MATTDTIFILEPMMSVQPATLGATLDTIADTSTPVGYTVVLDFDTSTQEFAYWFVTCPSHYDGGGFTVSWKGGTDNTSVGTFELEVGAIVIADATILTGDLGIDASTRTPITDTPPTTPINKMNQSTTGTITHANAGSPSAGSRMVWCAARDTATDTNTGDLQLLEILILET